MSLTTTAFPIQLSDPSDSSKFFDFFFCFFFSTCSVIELPNNKYREDSRESISFAKEVEFYLPTMLILLHLNETSITKPHKILHH